MAARSDCGFKIAGVCTWSPGSVQSRLGMYAARTVCVCVYVCARAFGRDLANTKRNERNSSSEYPLRQVVPQRRTSHGTLLERVRESGVRAACSQLLAFSWSTSRTLARERSTTKLNTIIGALGRWTLFSACGRTWHPIDLPRGRLQRLQDLRTRLCGHRRPRPLPGMTPSLAPWSRKRLP